MPKELNYNRVLLKKVLSRFKKNTNESRYICIDAEVEAGADASLYFREHIADLLFPKLTVEAWLIGLGIAPSLTRNAKNIHEYRIRWMQHMLDNDPFFESRKEKLDNKPQRGFGA